MSDVLLEVKDVSLSFGNKLILKGVNAMVRDIPNRGQVVCFLGPSGIGKTQLSRIIAGLQKPTSGEVLLNGTPSKPGLVSMVPQHYPMFDYLTVADNLRVAGSGKDYSELVEVFGLGEHLKKFPKELSGGTKQRVAIARQLASSTHFMVMDEPFSGLDPIMKKRTQEAIIKLASLDSLNTVIIVTHDVTEGLTVSDTVWMMGLENKEPGAKIVQTFDLAQMGFAWRSDLDHDPDFLKFVREVKDRFNTLR